MDGLAVATYLNNCILFTTRKTNVKKLNGGDESKIDNLFKHEALEYKNLVPAGLQFFDTILYVQNT